jgi:hypothetical protein
MSLAFDEGRETIETPAVSTISDSQRRAPNVRPSRVIVKTAVVMIWRRRQRVTTPFLTPGYPYLQLVENLEVDSIQVAQGHIL